MNSLTTFSLGGEDLDIQCALCKQTFDESVRCPRILPTCGHSLCESCIIRNIIQSQITFRCPIDGEIVFCARDNVEKFAKNFSLLKALASYDKQPQQQQQQFWVFEETTTVRPSVYPDVMLDVMKLKQQLQQQPLRDESEIEHVVTSLPPTSSNKIQLTLVCEEHHKIMDLACISCQSKICSHCAIFGDHKGHIVVPEDEVKVKNIKGISDMKAIQDNIERTRHGFIQKMEDNFQFNICKKIQSKKQEFLHCNKIKHEEYQKILQHNEQRSAESIEKYFNEIEEKFRKFKNHNFSETYEKIHSLNKLVGEMQFSSESLAERAELNFDLFLNLEKLMATAKDIELEFNNLLDFPLQLVVNYLQNLSIQFIDASEIANTLTNAMTLAFTIPEGDVIQQSIQHLTIANQREILMNSPFHQHLLDNLSKQEIEQILTADQPLTPSQAFFNQQTEIAQKQKYSIVPPQLNPLQASTAGNQAQRTTSGSSDSRKSTQSNGVRGITVKNNRFDKNNTNNIPSMTKRESSLNSTKDRMLLSHIETQEEFLRNTNFNGSFFQSVIVPDPIVNAFSSRDPIGASTFQSKIITEPQTNTKYASQQPQLQQQAQLIPSSSETNSYNSSSVRGTTSALGNGGGEISSISYQSSNGLTPSKQDSQMLSTSFPISPRIVNKSVNKTNNNNRFSQNSPLSTRINKSKTPPQRSVSPLNNSQTKHSATIHSYLQQNHQQKYGQNNEEELLSKSHGAKTMQQSTSQKTYSLKFFKQAQKNGLAQSNTSQLNNSSNSVIKKSQANAVNFKKKSEKFQDVISRLRTHQFIEVLDLVNEDINDAEAEELAHEFSRSQSNLESIKLVKNKIGNVGLKAILEGLKQGQHLVHTLNLTNNQCNEYCFYDLLQYLQDNPNLKNIYLLNNNIQPSRNKDHYKQLLQSCNLHLK